ncbi:isoleucyl-trna synthetase, putative [Theileria annulata]|uniref:Isoleucyl-trna synthetase, putative n=1 Tax=Theileria annulata TaxID=5874 RepID=Q4UEP5_THEAN|nr:isoleucyl-trna synthetase, putative [Theileria annulata]CAI74444.1 isoleucyl-trna synthetase, putative [Theileria annulata]|eukprot:XP_952176.1 isoleucyl-trna synthetase, putative [Theileria annulata]
MLILSVLFIYVTVKSDSSCVYLTQNTNCKNILNQDYNKQNYTFINPLNIIKSWGTFKGRDELKTDYDDDQISKTINLPRNVWPSFPDVNEAGIERQERVQKYWEEKNVYQKLFEKRFLNILKETKRYKYLLNHFKIIFDGPPYANGVPHLGHFLNKTIKDVFLRFFLLKGHLPIMIPGWDCHGMPIEHKILKMYNTDDNLDRINKELIKHLKEKEEEPDPEIDEMFKSVEHPLFTDEGSIYVKKYLNKIEDNSEEEKEEKLQKEKKNWTIFVRDKCQELAYRNIKAQKIYFKNAGIWGFWDYYYATYHSRFEKLTMTTFMRFYDTGLVYKELLPQIYSTKSKSVLADSEVIQKTKRVLTSFITFNVDLETCSKGVLKNLKAKMKELGLKDLKLVAWTTTSYTIPGNKGLAVDPKGDYHLYRKGNSLYIMNDLPTKSSDPFWSEFKRVGSLNQLNSSVESKETQLNGSVKSNGPEFREYIIDGFDMGGLEYYDPVYGNKFSVYYGNYVDLKKGTGIVHLSPAHGFDDYNTINADKRFKSSNNNNGFRYCNLFDKDENFYPDIHFGLVGMNIRDFNENNLLELLGENLLKYEYKDIEVDVDWRCENPVHTRLTKQYSLSLPQREEIVDLLNHIQITPNSARKYLNNIIMARNRDWCLSRQRCWGAPIPYEDKECLMTYESFEEGISDRVWKKSNRILDTMDIWFESAMVSKYTIEMAVYIIKEILESKNLSYKKKIEEVLKGCKKYVIEGQDQNRGWFQSLLIVDMLTKTAAKLSKTSEYMERINRIIKNNKPVEKKVPPFDNLFTHFFVKLKDQKLSKSKQLPKLDQNLERALNGTKELVVTNRDVDTKYCLYKPGVGDHKIDVEFSQVKDKIKPGYDIPQLLQTSTNPDNLSTKGSSELDKENNMYMNVDLLRTLVCNNDFLSHDLDLSVDSFKSSQQLQKKIVNCFKYIIGVLTESESEPEPSENMLPVGSVNNDTLNSKMDDDIKADWSVISIPDIGISTVKKSQLSGMDLYFLSQAYSLAESSSEYYRKGQFFKVLDMVEKFITSLSSVYLSYIKNFLYVYKREDEKNKAIRFVLFKILYILLRVLGPIVPHMCEDIYRSINPESISLFRRRWPVRPKTLTDVTESIGTALTVRKLINKQHAHSNNFILRLENNQITEVLRLIQDQYKVDLNLLFNVAGVEFVNKLKNGHGDGIVKYDLVDSKYKKCKRCWLFKKSVGENLLCDQCQEFLNNYYTKTK